MRSPLFHLKGAAQMKRVGRGKVGQMPESDFFVMKLILEIDLSVLGCSNPYTGRQNVKIGCTSGRKLVLGSTQVLGECLDLLILDSDAFGEEQERIKAPGCGVRKSPPCFIEPVLCQLDT